MQIGRRLSGKVVGRNFRLARQWRRMLRAMERNEQNRKRRCLSGLIFRSLGAFEPEKAGDYTWTAFGLCVFLLYHFIVLQGMAMVRSFGTILVF
ncbi:hypothetical protein Y032_0122g1049 [Ancylostoma ceylanicum]|uniref:Uncharacterized protein n=1 Tax=Ancylostoma ceylanicum TaxID=53326 RepID=A0A016T9T1_9BILA|nr:hypothetical protein Y032_0122g1049 [Ancylostoma ceylanicum]